MNENYPRRRRAAAIAASLAFAIGGTAGASCGEDEDKAEEADAEKISNPANESVEESLDAAEEAGGNAEDLIDAGDEATDTPLEGGNEQADENQNEVYSDHLDPLKNGLRDVAPKNEPLRELAPPSGR